MTITITIGRIEQCTTEAIVNPANEGLRRGGGACGHIFAAVERAGGVDRLEAACRAIGRCPTGSAVTTPSFGLPSKFIIHAVGPVWSNGNRDTITTNDLSPAERRDLLLLKSTYEAVVAECRTHGITSVSVPAISTGIFRLPKELGAAVAHAVCGSQNDVAVTLMAFDEENRRYLTAAPGSVATTVLRQAGII